MAILIIVAHCENYVSTLNNFIPLSNFMQEWTSYMATSRYTALS